MPRHKKTNRHLPPRLRFKHGAYYYVTRVDGRENWEWLSRDLMVALQEYAAREGPDGKGARTVRDAILQFLGSEARKLREKTQKGYKASAERLLPVFGEMRLEDVKPSDVLTYLRRSSAPIQANRDVALLSRAYTWANAWGWLDHVSTRWNPCERIPRNTEKGRKRYLTEDERARLAAAADPLIRCALTFAYLTGVRPGDMLRIRWRDVSDDGILVAPSKTRDSSGRETLFEWTDALRLVVEEIESLPGRPRRFPAVPLFATKAGKEYTTDGFNSMWQRVKKRAGVKNVRWSDLRRTAGSDKDTLEEARALLGHTETRTTRRFYRARPERVKPVK